MNAEIIVYCGCGGHFMSQPGGMTEFVQGQCAIPTNFRQTNVVASNGELDFTYTWDVSPSGYARSSLASCTVGEYVTYQSGDVPFPVPFPNLNPPNPTVINMPGNTTAMGDLHSTPGTFRTPYTNKTITATQIYRFQCPCHNGGAWETLMGPHSIDRTVENVGGWRFRITKTGETSTKGI